MVITKVKIASMLTVIGFVNALYLVIIKYANNPALCLQGIGDCWSVNNSRYSEIAGIPVALIGVIGFLGIGLILWLEYKKKIEQELAGYLFFGMSLFGTLFSLYLTYIEVFVINKICPFCVFSAVIILALLVLSIERLVTNTNPLP